MDVLSVKFLSMALLGGISLIVGLIPLLMKRYCALGRDSENKSSKNQGEKQVRKSKIAVSCLSCYGGGVILTTALTHMLPEVNTFLKNNIDKGYFPNTGMAIAEILVISGFIMVYIMEELAHRFIIFLNSQDKTQKGIKLAGVENENAYIGKNNDGIEDEDVIHHHEEFAAQLVTDWTKESNVQATMRGFLVILALSLHAVFEGIALGLTQSAITVWFLFFAIASHKYIISFCVGTQFISSGIQTYLVVIYVAVFSLISPMGTGIGITLSETATTEAALQTSLVTVLQGLATGTLLYVVFFEVIEKERQQGTNGILQVTFFTFGFLTMVLLEWLEVVFGPQQASTEYCVLNTIDKNWTFPMNFTCNRTDVISPHLVPFELLDTNR